MHETKEMKKFIEVTDRFSRKRELINIDYISWVSHDERTGLAQIWLNDNDASSQSLCVNETCEDIKELLSQNGLLCTRTDK